MIEVIKDKLGRMLGDKEVSLAMVLDRGGRILWHCGRSVSGRDVESGEGFPKSLIRQTLAEGRELEREDVVEACSGDGLPQSARALFLRSLLILPIDRGFFLYLDSGSKDAFSGDDLAVFRALGELLGESIRSLRSKTGACDGVAGVSRSMERVRDLVVSYALEEEPVLLLGETGVGKNHLAELIHQTSGRRGALVVVHCPSLPATLFESELFGHAKGAFTDAREGRSGLVAAADGGTLLLDEVSEIPLALQAKLLAFVESRRFRVVGSSTEHTADVRVLAATNRDLAEAVRSHQFRSDLYHRLNVLPIEIPPLRERIEDLRPLVEHHLGLLRGKRPGPGFFETLEGHPWPGNVRELVQVLRRAGIRLDGPELGAEVAEMLARDQGAAPAGGTASDRLVEQLEAELAAGAGFWDTAWRAFLDRELNREQLRALLKRLHVAGGGSLRRLAEALNLPPEDYPRLVSSLHKYRVHPAQE